MTGKKKATVREAHYRENPVRKVQRTKYKNVNHTHIGHGTLPTKR